MGKKTSKKKSSSEKTRKNAKTSSAKPGRTIINSGFYAYVHKKHVGKAADIADDWKTGLISLAGIRSSVSGVLWVLDSCSPPIMSHAQTGSHIRDPPTPVKLASQLTVNLARNLVNKDGKFSFNSRYSRADRRDLVDLLKFGSKAAAELEKVQDSDIDEDDSTESEDNDEDEGSQAIVVDPIDQERSDFIQELMDGWEERGLPLTPVEFMDLLRAGAGTVESTAMTIKEIIKRASRGIEYGSREEWQDAFIANDIVCASTMHLMSARCEVPNSNICTSAVVALDLLDAAETTSEVHRFLHNLTIKILAIEAHFALSKLSAREKKAAIEERYDAYANRVENGYTSQPRSLEQFKADHRKNVLAMSRLVKLIQKVGIYLLLDPGFSLAPFKTNNQSAKLALLCDEATEQVLFEMLSPGWFADQDNNSFQALMAILLDYAPWLIASLVHAGRLLGLNMPSSDDQNT